MCLASITGEGPTWLYVAEKTLLCFACKFNSHFIDILICLALSDWSWTIFGQYSYATFYAIIARVHNSCIP